MGSKLNSESNPSYDDLKKRLEVAESALQAIRTGQTDSIMGDKEQLVVRLARTEAREAHIKQILLAIRNVNQLIVKESDPLVLIEKACSHLTETLGYHNTWILLTRGGGDSEIPLTACSGFNGGFDLMEKLLHGNVFPACVKEALESDSVVIIKDPEKECPNCPLSTEYVNYTGLRRRLSHDEEVFGVLAVSIPPEYAIDTEEHDLFIELTDDLGFALHKIEEAEELIRSKELLDATGRMARVGGWELDAKTLDVLWTDETYRIHEVPVGNKPRLSEAIDFFHPDDRDRLSKAIQRALEYGEPYDMEIRFITAKGKQLWTRTICYPQINEGKTVRLLGTFQDITEVKEAEMALEATRRRYRELFENSRDGFVFVDISGQIMDANSAYCRMVGYTLEELRNMTDFYRITPSKWHDWERREIWEKRLLKEGYSGIYEKEYIRKDGSIFPVELQSYAVFNDDLSPQYLWGIARDISERKHTEEQLRSYQRELEDQVEKRTEELRLINKELEAFAYSVSHDLRAPLRAIHGFSRILMEEYVDELDDEAKRLGTVIQQNAAKMSRLIDELLAFSRLGREAIDYSSLDMKNMAASIYYEMTSEEDRKCIEFSVSDLPRIRGDASMLKQVWANLISNALKFTAPREKPLIRIDSKEGTDSITYTVSDNGVGFDMKYKDKLFRVFQRLHSDHEFEGTGVGLALVQRIIYRHGGEVEAHGEPGKGAFFGFTLPKED